MLLSLLKWRREAVGIRAVYGRKKMVTCNFVLYLNMFCKRSHTIYMLDCVMYRAIFIIYIWSFILTPQLHSPSYSPLLPAPPLPALCCESCNLCYQCRPAYFCALPELAVPRLQPWCSGGVVEWWWWCGWVMVVWWNDGGGVVEWWWWCSGMMVVVWWLWCGGVMKWWWWCSGVMVVMRVVLIEWYWWFWLLWCSDAGGEGINVASDVVSKSHAGYWNTVV